MMEDLLKSLLQSVEKIHDFEFLLWKWGRLFLHNTNINFHGERSACIEDILSLFNQHKISYHDVAELDLLSHMNNLRSLKWHSFRLEFKDNSDCIVESAVEEFHTSLRKCLLKFGYYDVVVKRHDDHSIWTRISKPGSLDAAYLTHISESRMLLCAGCENLQVVALAATKSCLSATDSVPSSIVQKSTAGRRNVLELVRSRKSRKFSLGKRKSFKLSSPSNRLTVKPIQCLSFKNSSLLHAHRDTRTPPLWIRGTIELFGTDVVRGLRCLHENNLAESIPTSLLAGSINGRFFREKT